MKTIKTALVLSLAIAGLSGCFKDTSGNSGDFGIAQPSVVLISLSAPGKFGVLDGEPQGAVGASVAAVQGDKSISVTPGAAGDFRLGYTNVPANTAFDVRVDFGGASNHRFVIPVTPSENSGLSSGEMSIPFNGADNACNGWEATAHLIPARISIQVGSKPQGPSNTLSFVLDCTTATGFSGSGSFCAYNYSRKACESLMGGQNRYGQWFFNPGPGISACKNFTSVENVYDYGFQPLDSSDAVGACAWAPLP